MNFPRAPAPSTPPTRWSPWALVATTLASLRDGGRRVLFIANPGNAGDALIASATWQFFDDMGLAPMRALCRDIRAGDVVIYAGGGNLVPMYHDAQRAIEAALQAGVSRFVLLPHTVRGNEALLASLDKRFVLFCRDKAGFQHVSGCAVGVQVEMAPDMALGLDVERLRQRVANLPHWWRWRWAGLRLRRLRSYQRWVRMSTDLRPDADGRLIVRRSDTEAAGDPGSAERDLSGLYVSAMRSRNECDAVAAQFLAVIDKAGTVVSDRLHVAIAGQLLNKQVELLDNSYGKNHEVANAFPCLMSNVQRAGRMWPCG